MPADAGRARHGHRGAGQLPTEPLTVTALSSVLLTVCVWPYAAVITTAVRSSSVKAANSKRPLLVTLGTISHDTNHGT